MRSRRAGRGPEKSGARTPKGPTPWLECARSTRGTTSDGPSLRGGTTVRARQGRSRLRAPPAHCVRRKSPPEFHRGAPACSTASAVPHGAARGGSGTGIVCWGRGQNMGGNGRAPARPGCPQVAAPRAGGATSDSSTLPPAPCRRGGADLSAASGGRSGLPPRCRSTFSPTPEAPACSTASAVPHGAARGGSGTGIVCWGRGQNMGGNGRAPARPGCPQVASPRACAQSELEGLRPARGGWPWVGGGAPGSRPAPGGGATNPLGLRSAADWPTWCHGAPPHGRRRSRVGGGCAPKRRGGAGGAGPKRAGHAPQKAPPPGAHASDHLVGPPPTVPACAGGPPSLPEPVARPPGRRAARGAWSGGSLGMGPSRKRRAAAAPAEAGQASCIRGCKRRGSVWRGARRGSRPARRYSNKHNALARAGLSPAGGGGAAGARRVPRGVVKSHRRQRSVGNGKARVGAVRPSCRGTSRPPR